MKGDDVFTPTESPLIQKTTDFKESLSSASAIILIRPFNTFGPRQSQRAIIPTIISQILSNNSLELGNLNPTRDLTYVVDTCKAYLEISKVKSFFGEVVNVGSNNEYKIEDIAKKIISKINPEAKISIESKRVRPSDSEVERLVCDNKLILNNTSWKPTIDFNEGLDLTIDWYKNFKDKFSHEIYHI